MNKIILMGRLTKDPELRTSGDGSVSIARYSLAVDRSYKRDGEPDADFFNIVAFGTNADFANKYLKKGMKILVEGHGQIGSYTNRDNVKIPTFNVIVDRHEFCESKSANASNSGNTEKSATTQKAKANEKADDFMNVADGIDEELPFN